MNEKPFLSYEDLVLAAKKVVVGKEEFIYNEGIQMGCVYFEDNAPSCLVGHMMYDTELYTDLETEPEWNDDAIGSLCSAGRPEENLLFHTDGRGQSFLITLQSEQDKGTPWGEALQKALEATQKL